MADFSEVVIKLGLIKEGEAPIYRHIPCSELDLKNPSGITAVDKLKKLAVLMLGRKNDSVKNVDLSFYHVDLTYNDTDDDKVLIFTNGDIMSALKEYMKVGKVKMLAEISSVDPIDVANTSTITDSQPTASVSTQTFVSNESCTLPKESPTESSLEPVPSESVPRSLEVPFVHEIPGVATFTMFHDNIKDNNDSAPPEFASCIANLLNFAAKAATNASASPAVREAMDHVTKAATAMEEQAKKAGAEAHNQAQAAAAAVSEETKKYVRNPQRAARQAARCARQASRGARGSVAAAVASTDPVNEGIPPPSVSEATTMPKSPEVVRPQPVANQTTRESVRPFIHGRHTCDGCLTTPIIGKRYHSATAKDFDLCEKCYGGYNGRDKFEEAQLDRDVPFQDRWHIRHARVAAGRRCGGGGRWQQLRQQQPHHHHNHIIPPPAPQHPPHEPPMAAKPQVDVVAAAIEDSALDEAIRRSLEDQKEKQASESKSVTSSNSTSTEKRDVSVVVVETVEVKDDDNEEKVSSNVLETNMFEPEITVAAKDIPIVDVPTENEAPVVSSEESVAPPLTSLPNEIFSFASSAEGATATLLGATLDQMAEAIDGLKWELDNDRGTSFTGDADDDQLSNEGEKILDGDEDLDDDEDDDDDSSNGHDSWQVVNEEEQIARAAQTLGSALFNSDMERSSENMSTLSNSMGTGMSSASGLSTLTTVPSAIRSLADDSKVAPIQFDRWATQLKKLHELGFVNDALNVDLLETLNAANIGVDSDEEVSVEQVIDAMMKNA